MANLPQRIICLTEETTETLYLLGEGHRVVGISGYTVRPPEARQKPKVSAFINARFDKILALKPDLVITFSDLQADITRELIRLGITVLAFNQRSVAEILNMILTLSSVVGATERGIQLVSQLESQLDEIRASASRFPFRPRVFFEEWNDPLISGISWVDELIEVAGGSTIFPELRFQKNAPERIVQPDQVLAKNPEVIIASWCGAKVNKRAIRARPHWDTLDAIRNDRVYEVKSTFILQPGPAALTEGVRQLHRILAHVVGAEVPGPLAPEERMDPALR